LKVAGAIRSFRGRSLEQFAAWLYRIASNEINNELRIDVRRRRSLEMAARLGAARSEPDWQGQRDFAIIQRHLLKMSTTDQTYIALRYFENMATADIGRIMQRSPQAVRTGLCRAVQRLRRRVLASAAPEKGS
jgi:RNA polymerase sigma factor (sigma-70 family)